MADNWVTDLMASALEDPGKRVVDLTCDEVEVGGAVVGRVVLAFTVEDLRGKTYEAKGRILLPLALRDEPDALRDAVMYCGYEASEEVAAKQVAKGRVCATTVQLPLDAVYPNSWALCRGPKMEFVLAHLLRSLPFVDPARIVYAGGSAGGYAALLTACEAFPAAATTPNVPPTNLAYGAAGATANYERLKGTAAPCNEWFEGWVPVVAGWRDAFGDDLDHPAWLAHSPVGHVHEITCPVATFFSMADCLVPIDQVDRALAAAMIQARPSDLEVRAEQLTDAAAGRVRLLDVLGDRADVHVVPMPEEFAPMVVADLTTLAEQPPFTLPDLEPVAGRWSITVADEGTPVWVVSHYKHCYEPDFEPFTARALAADEIGVDQLTRAKLEQLLDRYAGTEWFAPGFPYLDRPEAERADVERGLRRYCRESLRHQERFAALYDVVDDGRRVLPPALLAELSPQSAPA